LGRLPLFIEKILLNYPEFSTKLSSSGFDLHNREITIMVALMLDSISINMSFIPLSTCINPLGEIERRFLTPFGIVDVVYRASKHDRKPRSQFEQEIFDEADIRIVFGQAFVKLKTKAEGSWSETARKFLAEKLEGDAMG
jgi:hypothetical protein